MSFENLKISAEEINSLNVKSAADSYSNNSPRDNKNIFDRLPEHIAEKHNLLGGSSGRICGKYLYEG